MNWCNSELPSTRVALVSPSFSWCHLQLPDSNTSQIHHDLPSLELSPAIVSTHETVSAWVSQWAPSAAGGSKRAATTSTALVLPGSSPQAACGNHRRNLQAEHVQAVEMTKPGCSGHTHKGFLLGSAETFLASC